MLEEQPEKEEHVPEEKEHTPEKEVLEKDMPE